jgi:putative Ca2+/H+ antiporter (TMEM165/GDT1 family)
MGMSKKEPTQSNPDFWDNLGKLLLDMAKLTFASLILGGILQGKLPQNILITAGGIAFVVFGAAGLILTSRKKNRR